jgi:gamma-glutamyl-gamma-aminobutyrate hydrolase PuuD
MDKIASRMVYIVEPSVAYERMFKRNGWELTDIVGEADLVQFTGGEDVSPYLYDEKVHPTTHHNSQRDRKEARVFDLCSHLRIPMAGICRGGQFLNVMCGGKMYQHVNNHAIGGTHMMVYLPTGQMIPVSSTHHQMMRPGWGAVTLGVASESTFYEHMDGDSVNTYHPQRGEDIEALFYPAQRVLCYQPHPEYMEGSECEQVYFDMIEERLMEVERCVA